MGSHFALFLVSLSITCNSALAASPARFRVGDDQGWRQPDGNNTDLYNVWAQNIHFHVGDSLIFVYKNDSVLRVDKGGYYHCNTTNPIETFNDGQTVISLDKPDFFYFISGNVQHCKNGQRLFVDRVPYAQPPSTDTPMQPPPESPDPSPAPGANAAGILGPNVVGMVVGTVIAIMLF